MSGGCLVADLRTNIASHVFVRDWTTRPSVDCRLCNQVDIMRIGSGGDIYQSYYGSNQ